MIHVVYLSTNDFHGTPGLTVARVPSRAETGDVCLFIERTESGRPGKATIYSLTPGWDTPPPTYTDSGFGYMNGSGCSIGLGQQGPLVITGQAIDAVGALYADLVHRVERLERGGRLL